MPNAVLTDWPSGPVNAGWPIEPTAMLEPGKVEGWPAGTQRTTTAAARLLSQAVGYWDARSFRDGDRFLRNLGTGGDLLDMRLGSAAMANSNDPLYLAPDQSGGYVYLPGASGNRLQILDANDLDLTGDLDIRVRVAMDSWAPGADSILASKFTSPSQRSWFLRLTATGSLTLQWSNDGSTLLGATSTTAIGLNAGDLRWVRATLDVDNGASGNSVEFFTSLDGTNWTKLGNTVTTAGVTSVFASTADIFVGSASGSEFCAGKFYAFQLRNGINGTTVLDIDCDAITSGAATSFAALTGQTVTINRSSTGRKCVAVPRGGPGVVESGYVYLPGATGNYLSVPDENALDITGDIDLRVRVRMDDWTPAADVALLGKWTTSGSQRSYRFDLQAAGTLRIFRSTTGADFPVQGSTASVPFADGDIGWVRATLDVDNGAGGCTATFYTSTDGSTWTQLGNAVTTAGTTSIYAGTSIVEVGSFNSGAGQPMAGRVYRAQVLNGINGTTVLDIDCDKAGAKAPTAFEALTGQTVSVNRASTGAATAVVPRRVTTGGQPVFLLGTDDYMEIQDTWQHGLLNFDTGDSFTAVVAYRLWATPPSNARIIAKSNTSTSTPGWTARMKTDFTAEFLLWDQNGLQAQYAVAPASNAGRLSTLTTVVSKSSQTCVQYMNGVAGTALPFSTIGTLSGPSAFRVGSEASNQAYADMEFYAAAVFRRALTASEVALLTAAFSYDTA